MTYFGFTMLVNGVPEDYKGIQLIEHRMLSWIDPNLLDDQIMHKLANDVFTDFAFSKPLTLSGILDNCIKYGVIPIINLCITEGTWKNHTRLSPAQCAKIGGVLRDYLKNRGFTKGKAYIAVFNEPNTQVNLSAIEVCNYSNAVHDKVGNDFDVIYGNDEMGNLDWNYLGKNCRAKVTGVHFLSSLGSWENPKKNWYRIEGAKTTANLYGKKLIGTECGSWFKDYCGEGHQINLDILAECKKYDIDCLIVLPDVNEITKGKWKLLGYRVFNNDFTKIVGGCQDKFDQLMNFIKTQGTVPNIIIPIVEDDMILQKIYKIGSKGIGVKFIQRVLNEDIDVELPVKLVVDGGYGAKTAEAVKLYQKEYNLVQDGMVGEKTMKVMIFDNPNLFDEIVYEYAIGYR